MMETTKADRDGFRTVIGMDTTVAPITGLEWDHLVEAGILDGPFELVGGRKVRKMTIDPPHAATVSRLVEALRDMISTTQQLRPGHPIALGPVDRPEPDLAVVTARDDYYIAAHPGARDVHLVIEVSISSLATDLGEKAERYAYAGIPEYWVVDVEAQVVVVHLDPVPEQGVWGSVTRISYGSRSRPARSTDP